MEVYSQVNCLKTNKIQTTLEKNKTESRASTTHYPQHPLGYNFSKIIRHMKKQENTTHIQEKS